MKLASQLSEYMQDQIAALITSIDTYMELYTSAPTNAGGGTACTGSNYVRVKIPAGGWTVSGHSPKVLKNTNVVTYLAAGGSWGTLTHWGLFTALSSGNFLAWNTISPTKTISTGETAQFNALTLEIDLGT